jgi:hypothetical protein
VSRVAVTNVCSAGLVLIYINYMCYLLFNSCNVLNIGSYAICEYMRHSSVVTFSDSLYVVFFLYI